MNRVKQFISRVFENIKNPDISKLKSNIFNPIALSIVIFILKNHSKGTALEQINMTSAFIMLGIIYLALILRFLKYWKTHKLSVILGIIVGIVPIVLAVGI